MKVMETVKKGFLILLMSGLLSSVLACDNAMELLGLKEEETDNSLLLGGLLLAASANRGGGGGGTTGMLITIPAGVAQ